MSLDKQKLTLSWEDIYRTVWELGLKLKLDEYRPDLIIGVFRGGVIPAAMLQRTLAAYGPDYLADYKMSTVFAASYNKANQQQELKVEVPRYVREMVACSHNVLIVDDICDSGRTIKELVKVIDPQVAYITIRTGVLITKKPKETNYFGHYVESNAWVEFPWEM